MTKTEKTNIGDHEYSVRQWDATKAMMMQLKTAKYLGKAISVFAAGGDVTGNLLGHIDEILDGVDEEKFIGFVKSVVCDAIRDGERMVLARFDEYFQGDVMDAYKVFAFVLKVNFADFLGSVLS